MPIQFRDAHVSDSKSGRKCRKTPVKSCVLTRFLAARVFMVSSRTKSIDPFFRRSYCPTITSRTGLQAREAPETNRPRKQLESSAPLGFAASGIFFALRLSFFLPLLLQPPPSLRRMSVLHSRFCGDHLYEVRKLAAVPRCCDPVRH